MSQPTPPPPGQHPEYASRQTPTGSGKEIGDLGAPQAVFDTVAGPNLRLRDNLIQLASIAVAVVLVFLVALFFTRDIGPAIAIGLLGGLILGVLISGAILGIYRGMQGVKRMSEK